MKSFEEITLGDIEKMLGARSVHVQYLELGVYRVSIWLGGTRVSEAFDSQSVLHALWDALEQMRR